MNRAALVEDEKRWGLIHKQVEPNYGPRLQHEFVILDLISAIRTRDEALRRAWGLLETLLFMAEMLEMPPGPRIDTAVEEARALLVEIGTE